MRHHIRRAQRRQRLFCVCVVSRLWVDADYVGVLLRHGARVVRDMYRKHLAAGAAA